MKDRFLIRVFQGMLIGLGAVLPGISGGVLCVVFGIYRPMMELMAHPFQHFKTHVPKLFPVLIGVGAGFLGIANILSIVLDRFPSQSVCVFIGLIAGMLPSLFREANEKGTSKGANIALFISMFLVFVLLTGLRMSTFIIVPGFFWYLFCGFCLAISVIAPGMSFSTLLMPLGLYTPFIEGIGHFSFPILIPAGIGALLTVIGLSRLVNWVFERFYSKAFYAIIGVVIAATVMIIPFDHLGTGMKEFVIDLFCIAIGFLSAFFLDKLNCKIS